MVSVKNVKNKNMNKIELNIKEEERVLLEKYVCSMSEDMLKFIQEVIKEELLKRN